MKKLLMLFVLCGLISGQAWGDAAIMTVDEVWYGCKQKGWHNNITNGRSFQFIGKTTLGKAEKLFRKAYCTDPDGWFSDAYFSEDNNTNWCDNSLFKHYNDADTVPNALYCLVKDGRQVSCLKTAELAKKAHGAENACVYARCDDNSVMVSDGGNGVKSCKPRAEAVKCKESGNKLIDSYGAGYIETGKGVGVYCVTEEQIGKIKLAADNQNNICKAAKHTVRNNKDPETFFSCDNQGKWQRNNYESCKNDECTKGQSGCVPVLHYSDGNRVEVVASEEGEFVVMDDGNTFCIKWMCNEDTHVKSGNKCITKAQHQAHLDAVNRQNKITAENKRTCEASGGTWASNKCTCNAQNVTLSGNLCVCISGYEWNADKKQGCKLTDKKALEEACNAAPAGTATWNDAAGACVCTNPDQTFDIQRKACVDNQDYAACKPLVTRRVATWNSEARLCVCNQRGYIIENNDCVESPQAAAERQERERAEALRVSRRKISDAHGILVGMRETFKASVWKDEEGKFNTARLVSDSVAGVVLGTVGGVVTSNVVKKNQVENGFEDIKCAVGGQTVADWGDEFRVGIQ